MKILHIFDHSIPLHSGYTFRSRAILVHQQMLGWETYHLTSSKHNKVAKPSLREEKIDGLYFYRSDELGGLLYQLPLINQFAVVKSLRLRLDEVIPQIKPDIIHAHSPALNGLAAVLAGEKFKLPVVYEIRAFWEDAAVDHGTSSEWGVRYRLSRALETYVLKNVNAVTTICEGLRGDIIKRSIPVEKVTVIPNAVEIEKFKGPSKSRRKELQVKFRLKNALVLGFVGSFYAYEGLSLLINAIPKVMERHKNIKVLMVGGGPEENALKILAEQLAIEDKVIFTGRVPHEEVKDYYDLIDILIYPRLSMRLTELVTPLKPLEAMAQKKIFIASDVGGHKELIENNKTGYLFKSGDLDELIKTINYVVSNSQEWERLKDAGRQYVEQERNWTRSVNRYKPIYQSLV